ncbi:hypothetical protein PTSG_11480 [Salpingoeca rosetta]|uniref:HECT-type E3 ubiquitin transferase n=1 Tax=Salpingoeca rosetta (strain ATCC 50818 / BSB-021) TaxID=946362 RepID=F2UTK9_SALR5|nr:uncharacterized protein PTSG_11480 [Salpingoeca rosetta]EGD72982.1 hypothetical protein PTSG_11480 [Salpingoeca rosetta]|eukprot:XP_004987494.1 hypothetical protein PTSG_11480 [Salpingoeca rosetta]
MFKPIAGNTLIWINAHTHEPLRSFYYFGVLVGLALYNSVNIRLNLPLAFYKQLLDRRADASDFRAMFPDLAHGLDQLLEYPGDVETDICSTYSVSDMYLGEAIEQPLIEGGNDIVVTNETRQQYVKDYIEFVLHKSMEQQMGAIRNGFMAVMAGWAVNLCTPAELQVMICGRDDIDLSTMKPSAAYIGYEESDDTIQHLWRFLDSLDDEGKRNFLLFVSGSARVPLGGLQSLHFTIQRAEHTNFSRLPTAMTCFNRLVLPAYPTEELLRQRVQTAIDNAQGFGLV